MSLTPAHEAAVTRRGAALPALRRELVRLAAQNGESLDLSLHRCILLTLSEAASVVAADLWATGQQATEAVEELRDRFAAGGPPA